MSTRRALHFVFKVGNLKETAKFYRSILGMKTLRYEYFEEGCQATCNGPYDGKWSKTMIGYGGEDDHFVVELTYNYGVKDYKLGNDFQGLTIHSKEAVANAKKHKYDTCMVEKKVGHYLVRAPGGYPFFLVDENVPGDPVQKVSLGVSSLSKSLDYWHKLLGMTVVTQSESTATLAYDINKCKLELVQLDGQVDHAAAFGRIAFSCPKAEQLEIQNAVKEAGHTIITPLVELDTPGKATVQVVILGDPDGHEICFVEDEGFRELSKFDPEGDRLLSEGIENDKSDEWFAKKSKSNSR